MNLDIIIHPTFAEEYMSKYLNSPKIWQDYLDDLKDNVSGNECVVLLKPKWNRDLNDFEKKLNPHYIFNTESDYFVFPGTRGGGMREDTGFVVKEEINKLGSLVESSGVGKINIHGSYFGYCLTEFVLQLYFLSVLKKELRLGEYKENFFLEEDIDKTTYTNIRKYSPKMPENLQWGVVLLHPYTEVPLYTPNTVEKNKGIDFPFGNIEYQLLSLESRLYAVKMSKEQKELAMKCGAKVLANTRS